MANNPIFIGTPKVGLARLSNQVLNRAGDAGTDVVLWTAGASGSFIDTVYAWTTGDVAANVLRLFLTLSGETTKQLIREVSLTAVASSDNVTAISGYPIAFTLPSLFAPAVTGQTGLILPALATLSTALGTAEATSIFTVQAIGGDY